MAEDTPGIRTSISPERKLGYTTEFKQLVHEHPGIIRSALDLMQTSEEIYSPSNLQFESIELKWNPEGYWNEVYEKNGERKLSQFRFNIGPSVLFKESDELSDPSSGLVIQMLGKHKRKYSSRFEDSSYFKIQLGDDAFFVKKSRATVSHGFTEFQGSIRLAEVLKDLENVDTVDAQLGFVDGEHSFFVSRWRDLEDEGFFPYDDYDGRQIANSYGTIERDESKMRVQLSVEKLRELQGIEKTILERAEAAGIQVWDFDGNIFYNPETDRYLVLDIFIGDPLQQKSK